MITTFEWALNGAKPKAAPLLRPFIALNCSVYAEAMQAYQTVPPELPEAGRRESGTKAVAASRSHKEGGTAG